ncbi:helix-turn-helix transcriptional regulator [Clostridium sp. SHJSY1]|uniref:winged helix-turn-helix transcriptional regulator n=1 Tax=Clostridium sp. SHJSY1 TaxID=2942483 RepID=UPI00287551FA|nr:helix-turn-helix domain-containing protein [Clostridium sp. SHJSY1]MDS0524276.1 helix-turn-helix transcriptional regulator [Clostridium sp. SHJSY1]
MDKELDAHEKSFLYTIELINGKWKMNILFLLSKRERIRYGELKRSLGNVTHKMLSNRLKELEQDKLIIRTDYKQIPPKVEYSLSEIGMSFIPILNAVYTWGCDYFTTLKE